MTKEDKEIMGSESLGEKNLKEKAVGDKNLEDNAKREKNLKEKISEKKAMEEKAMEEKAMEEKAMEDNTLTEVRKMFEEDRFATENGAVIEEIGNLYAKCIIQLTQRHKNALGAVMGGVSFMLADFAFAVASNWQNPGVVSLSSNITYLGTAKGRSLIAQAKCIKDGRTISYYRIDVSDELGNIVAAVTTTGYRK